MDVEGADELLENVVVPSARTHSAGDWGGHARYREYAVAGRRLSLGLRRFHLHTLLRGWGAERAIKVDARLQAADDSTDSLSAKRGAAAGPDGSTGLCSSLDLRGESRRAAPGADPGGSDPVCPGV